VEWSSSDDEKTPVTIKFTGEDRTIDLSLLDDEFDLEEKNVVDVSGEICCTISNTTEKTKADRDSLKDLFLIDCGCSRTMIRSESAFVKLYSSTVNIKVVGGTVKAGEGQTSWSAPRLGLLKENIFGIKVGIWYAHLDHAGIIATCQLQKGGHAVILPAVGSSKDKNTVCLVDTRLTGYAVDVMTKNTVVFKEICKLFWIGSINSASLRGISDRKQDYHVYHIDEDHLDNSLTNDYWTRESGTTWTRVHITPRRALFTPTRTVVGPNKNTLTSGRETYFNIRTPESLRKDDWKDSSCSHKVMDTWWTGRTVFKCKLMIEHIESVRRFFDTSSDDETDSESASLPTGEDGGQPHLDVNHGDTSSNAIVDDKSGISATGEDEWGQPHLDVNHIVTCSDAIMDAKSAISATEEDGWTQPLMVYNRLLAEIPVNYRTTEETLDILDVAPRTLNGTVSLVFHQTNCRTTRAAGLAKEIFDHWPELNVYSEDTLRIPGTAIVMDVDAKRFPTCGSTKVVNLFGQNRPSGPSRLESRETRLGWFEDALDSVCTKEFITNLIPSRGNTRSVAGVTLNFPENIGCGMAGGIWKEYKALLLTFSRKFTKLCHDVGVVVQTFILRKPSVNPDEFETPSNNGKNTTYGPFTFNEGKLISVAERDESSGEEEEVPLCYVAHQVDHSHRSKLEIHRASGHVLFPNGFKKECCPDCVALMGQRHSFRKLRPKKYHFSRPLQGLAGDYWGPLSPSIRKKKIVLVILDDATRRCWLFPIETKNEVTAKVREVMAEINSKYSGKIDPEKLVYFIRFDNEPVLTSAELDKVADECKISIIHSVPYCPQQNGVAERFMRTLATQLGTVLRGVDMRLHCYATTYVGVCLNNAPRKAYPRLSGDHGGKTPLEVLEEYFPLAAKQKLSATHMKRFGCLVFFLNEPLEKHYHKGGSKWKRGAMLGYRGSAPLIGHWIKDKRQRSGRSWTDSVVGHARFFESILIEDIDDLREDRKGVSVPFDKLDKILIEQEKEVISRLPRGGKEVRVSRAKSVLGGKSRKPFSAESNLYDSSAETADLAGSHCHKFLLEQGREVQAKRSKEMVEASGLTDFGPLGRGRWPFDKDQGVPTGRAARCSPVAVTQCKSGDGVADAPKGKSSVGKVPGVSGGKHEHGHEHDGEVSEDGDFGEDVIGDVEIRKRGRSVTRTHQQPVKRGRAVPRREDSVETPVEEDVVPTSKKKRKREKQQKAARTRKGKLVEQANLIEETINYISLDEHFNTNSNSKEGSQLTVGEAIHYVSDFDTCEPKEIQDLLGWEEGEKLEEVKCYTTSVSLTAAMKTEGEEKERWVAALTKEETRVKGYDTFGPPMMADEIREIRKEGHKVLPIALLLTIKRCGTYKCRAVVLGNREDPSSAESYSPVVSQNGNRYLLASAITDGDDMKLFDLDNAFLNAEIDDVVIVKLPVQWREQGENGLRRLKKALYGLRRAPRAWSSTYTARLKVLGWEPCPQVDGLWKKKSAVHPGRYLKMSVYVDDNVIAGPDTDEITSCIDEIFQSFPGRIIEPREIKNFQNKGVSAHVHDILGQDVTYERTTKFLNVNMPGYIRKKCAIHDAEWAENAEARLKRGENPFHGDDDASSRCEKTVVAPVFLEEHLETKTMVTGFKVREALGCLQWCATTCRPDIAAPVSVLARYAAKPPHKGLVGAIRKVFRYLFCTMDEGLTYSPEEEEKFKNTYQKLIPASKRLPDKTVFSDASFASCHTTMKSTSGGIIYFRSFPISWRTKRQTIRTYSTAESEYVAASDVITLSMDTDFTDFYRPRISWDNAQDTIEDEVIFVDNESAIATAKSTDLRPKSRHYALRWHKVRDHSDKIHFCPTTLMKADGLTKVAITKKQRDLLLHHEVVNSALTEIPRKTWWIKTITPQGFGWSLWDAHDVNF